MSQTPITSRSPSRANAVLSRSRAANEYYPTPPEATRALLSAESFSGSIWEPACGEGWISQVLIDAGLDVVSTDLHEYGFGTAGIDFLKTEEPLARNIVTNPPYGSGLADRFVRKSLQHIEQTGGCAAMLLNIASLCHPSRHDSFVRRPPAVIYALDSCVCLPNGKTEQATAHTFRHRYCWAIWHAAKSSRTEMVWLTTRDYQLAA